MQIKVDCWAAGELLLEIEEKQFLAQRDDGLSSLWSCGGPYGDLLRVKVNMYHRSVAQSPQKWQDRRMIPGYGLRVILLPHRGSKNEGFAGQPALSPDILVF